MSTATKTVSDRLASALRVQAEWAKLLEVVRLESGVDSADARDVEDKLGHATEVVRLIRRREAMQTV